MPRFLLRFALAAFALLAVTAHAQETHEVRMLIQEVEGSPIPQFYFEPTGLHVQPGDTVRFIADTPHHTVTAYHPQQGKPLRVPEGVPPFSSPVIPVGQSWEYTFDTRGVYDLWCAPHEQYGMVMRLVVGDAADATMEPPTGFGPTGVFGAAATVLTDPALNPLNIVSEGAVSWDAIAPEAKQMPAVTGTVPH